MDLDRIARIKKLTLKALFADNEFVSKLVLKGGNAIDLVHGCAQRASFDIDLSIETDFSDEVSVLAERFEELLSQAFEPCGFQVLDVRFQRKPAQITPDLEAFWGGYLLEFKIIPQTVADQAGPSERAKRVRSESVDFRGKKSIRVEFSRHEYCEPKVKYDLDGLSVYAYPPLLIVCEKLRAICQQRPSYRAMVKSHRGAVRARDFFDIFVLARRFRMRLEDDASIKLLKHVFAAKRVPLSLIHEIHQDRDLHRAGYNSLRDTVLSDVFLQPFDYYFDFVLDLIAPLKIGGNP